jgi:YjcQ protein
VILDAKRKILLAIFLEYQKDIYNMDDITPENLEMEKQVFNVAVHKLQHEGYIEGAHISLIKGEIYFVRIREALPTPRAIHYLEQEFELQANANSEEKSKRILKSLLDSGMERAESILSKVVAELIKG